MIPRRCSILVLGLALTLFASRGMAQDKKPKIDKDKERDGLIARVLNLMPPGYAAELNLTAEQRGQIQKLEQEFKTQRVASLMKTAGKVMAIVEGMDADEGDRELAPILALTHEITGGLLESRRTRLSYEKKMVALLNADQQAKFAHLKELRPRDRRDLAGQAVGGTTFHFYYTPQGQEKLQLTDEQKRKLGELQKEMENQLRTLLTEEQRRILDAQQREKSPSPKSTRPGKEPKDRED
jgi:Spy/CpxP family protein refolding chaperone